MIEITAMCEEHVSQVAEIEMLCFSDPWSEKSISSELTNDLSCWLVAVDGDNVVGYVGSQTVIGESDMMNIAVRQEYRRKGIAQELISELIRGLMKRGSHCLSLEVRESNAAAISLYERNGFAAVGKRPRYYYNPREDALIMRKEWTV